MELALFESSMLDGASWETWFETLRPLWAMYAVLLIVFFVLIALTRRIRGRFFLLAAIAVVFLVSPVSEELWIAWHFAQACERAGTTITKTAEADGYFVDGTGWALGSVQPDFFKFAEYRDRDGYKRVTAADAELVRQALAYYKELHPGEDPEKRQLINVKMDDHTRVMIFVKQQQSWRISQIDQPTARYWYDWKTGMKVDYKVTGLVSTLTDTQSNEVIARYVRYYRQQPWFVDYKASSMACDRPGDWHTRVSDEASFLHLTLLKRAAQAK